MSSAQAEVATGYYTVGDPIVDDKAPPGPLEERWDSRKFHARLISPANRRALSVIIVGTGLAGAAAAATLGEAGYRVTSFCYQDSPRRAHSIAAQGGINAAKNYRNDGDSTYRLFYDTVKGGDFRSRESNVYRLAQVSDSIIDQCVAQGVPFAREYGGLLDTRSFGGVQVSRTFYARGQTGQQLLLGAYQALQRQVAAGTVEVHTRHEMLDLIDVEPWRATPFPIIKDLVVDRGGFDRIIAAGGYISAPTGAAPDAQAVPVPKTRADAAFDAATCIGCGACVAACPNGSAALFLGAKITHLGDLPQGQAERSSRALAMIDQHDAEGFGGCTQIGECTAVCPKGIQLDVISRYHRDVLAALIHHED